MVQTMLERQEERANKYLEYFVSLKKNNPERAKEEAKKELIAMGILNPDGSKKDIIVSWE
ncbi:MAG: hypothetical protein K6G45_01680 [Lachnospiraceae bacterium]|nr:hypothetical protein [Lachnospiraceae bacterium]